MHEINTIQEKFFDIFIIVSYLLIIIIALGLTNSAPIYLETMDYYVKLYVSLFLIWRFNNLKLIPRSIFSEGASEVYRV